MTGMTETSYLPAIKRVHFSAPFAWLLMGWRDLKAAPGPTMAYGTGLALLSIAIASVLYLTGQFTWFLVLAGGFMIVAPILGMGLYWAAAQLHLGRRPTLYGMIRQLFRSRSDIFLLGVALFVLFGIWVEAAYLIYGLSTSAVHSTIAAFLTFLFTTPEGRQMAAIGTLVGGVIAFGAFSVVAISAPMLASEDRDAFVAIVSSVRSVLANLPAMLVWGAMILVLTMIGIATAFVGLAVIFPWIGLSSWHASRALVDHGNGP
jgi:uncharacterized membrane protein